MYIPTFEGTPLSFLQQIMSTEKKFFKKSETFNAVIPNWPELSVKRIWPEAIKHKDFLLYLPDNWLQDKKTERAFFWTILATLQPDYCLHLIDDCRRQRDSLRLPPRPPPVKQLDIHPMFVQALLDHPQLSGKYQFLFLLIIIFTLGRKRGGNALLKRPPRVNQKPPPIRNIKPVTQMQAYVDQNSLDMVLDQRAGLQIPHNRFDPHAVSRPEIPRSAIDRYAQQVRSASRPLGTPRPSNDEVRCAVDRSHQINSMGSLPVERNLIQQLRDTVEE